MKQYLRVAGVSQNLIAKELSLRCELGFWTRLGRPIGRVTLLLTDNARLGSTALTVEVLVLRHSGCFLEVCVRYVGVYECSSAPCSSSRLFSHVSCHSRYDLFAAMRGWDDL